MSGGPFLLALMGQTASGKSELAERLAERFDAQLINADAFQVYRGFDIGTAKPAARDQYLLLDIHEPCEQFGVGEFALLASDALTSLWETGRSAILVGGTGLYIRALTEEYADMGAAPSRELRASLDRRLGSEGVESLASELRRLSPGTAGRTDLSNPARVRRALEKVLSPGPAISFKLSPFRLIKAEVWRRPEDLSERIEARLDTMLREGWEREVRSLQAAGVRYEDPAMRAIGYRTIWRAIEGALPAEQARAEILSAMRSYAKRQRTWLRREPNLRQLDASSGLQLQQVVELIRSEERDNG